jgi:Fic-DOC domain mobile mystery protein B
MGHEMKLEYPEGATPLDPTEAKGLKLPHITTREQLNRWEQENVFSAESKYFSRKHRDILSEAFILRLHRQMFGDVWKWAGKYRTSDKNIGSQQWDIAVNVRVLCEDAKLWIESKTDSADEVTARFHHRLVFIHPFSNGNGRHARMMADLLLVNVFEKPRFTWGQSDLVHPGATRYQYLNALRAADKRDFSLLNKFVRS